ncbi:MAG: viperin family antiviral radical SAM protein [Roseivirga sp.]
MLGDKRTEHTLLEDLGWSTINRKLFNTGIKSVDPRITHACDHECPHCWANLYGKHMSLNMFDKVLKLGKLSGIEIIQFTGGEPTLNRGMIHMAQAAKSNNFKIILRTHGRNLYKPFDDSSIETWAEKCVELFDEIVVSIDGTPQINFLMRPVINYQKLSRHGRSDKDRIASRQFEETVLGYQALSSAAQLRTNITLKINTVITALNMHDMEDFGQLLSNKVIKDGLRIDWWEFTQVFPSPENNKEEQSTYVVDNGQFLKAVALASNYSQNISKQAKPITSARCLIVDENGRTYMGGQENLELGSLKEDNINTICSKISSYERMTSLSSQRAEKYLVYNAIKN